MVLQGPDFSDSEDPIFSDSRGRNRVPKTPLKNPASSESCQDSSFSEVAQFVTFALTTLSVFHVMLSIFHYPKSGLFRHFF